MYRVFLVDDEAIIIEGLKKVVDWQQFGCEVCGSASDGQGALEAIRASKPDLLFTDIRMPEMDGLTMVAALRSEFPNLQIAILTGYHDFAYAQQAVRLGVTRLLAKPSRMEELEEAISAMTQNLAALKVPETAAVPTEDEGEKELGSGSFLVRQALAYIEETYAQKLTLQKVAEHCYVSQWHLSKLLNRHTGKSFYEILNSVRIKQATALLRNPRLRIADVSELVGYTEIGRAHV